MVPLAAIRPKGTAGGPQFDYYVDSVNGNGGNAGRSPAQAFQALASVPWANKLRVGLARGSHWREAISQGSTSSLLVGTYGVGALPIVNGSDIITGWIAEGAANVWKKDVAHDAAGTDRLRVYEDGILLARVSDVATCSTTPGSFVDIKGSDGSPLTVKIRPSSGNPTTNGKTYEVTVRERAGLFGATAIIRGYRAERGISNNGAFEVGLDADVREILSVDGSKHNLLVQSGILTDVVCCRADPVTAYELSNTFFVGFTPDAAGKALTLRRCLAVGDSNGGAVALIMHDLSSHTYATFTGEQLGVVGLPYGFQPSAEAIAINGYFAKLATSAFGCDADDGTFRYFQVNAGSSDTGLAVHRITPNSTLRFQDGAFYDTGSNNGLVRLTSALNGASLEFERCVFYHSAFRPTMTDEGMTSGSIKVRNCIFVYSSGNGDPIVVPTGVTYIGDNNVFVPQNNLNCSYHGANKTTLAAWQLATGQDDNSIVVAAANLSQLFLGVAADGDFRLGASGAGAQAAALLAGPQQHWDWNARGVASGPPATWPVVPQSLVDSQAYVDSPTQWGF